MAVPNRMVVMGAVHEDSVQLAQVRHQVAASYERNGHLTPTTAAAAAATTTIGGNAHLMVVNASGHRGFVARLLHDDTPPEHIFLFVADDDTILSVQDRLLLVHSLGAREVHVRAPPSWPTMIQLCAWARERWQHGRLCLSQNRGIIFEIKSRIPIALYDRPLRIPVQHAQIVGGIGTLLHGRVETGSIHAGNRITIAPMMFQTEAHTPWDQQQQQQQQSSGLLSRRRFLRAGDVALCWLRPLRRVCLEPASLYGPVLGRFAMFTRPLRGDADRRRYQLGNGTVVATYVLRDHYTKLVRVGGWASSDTIIDLPCVTPDRLLEALDPWLIPDLARMVVDYVHDPFHIHLAAFLPGMLGWSSSDTAWLHD